MKTSTRMTLAAGWATALGAVPLGAVFSEWRWIWYAWAAVAAVIGAHLLARSLRLPALLVPLAGALGLLLYLTLVFASDAAIAGLIPTAASLDALRTGLNEGMTDVNQMAAPVPATSGLVVLTTVAVGALAIVVDLVAVVLRRPAAAGLALLALYAVPTAVASDGVPWLLFVVGATGYLVLLLAEGRERLLRWGRPVAEQGTATGSIRPAALPLTGHQIGATALAIAVVIPVLMPGLTSNALSNLGRRGTGTGDGSGTGTAQNPFTSLRGDLQRSRPIPLFTVQVNLTDPFYLRTNVLEDFTDAGWQERPRRGFTSEDVPGQLSSPALADGGPNGQRPYQADITIQNYDGRYLPMYYLPERITGNIPDGWRYDARTAVIYSRLGSATKFRYEVSGLQPEPDKFDLARTGDLTTAEQVEAQSWLELPSSLPAQVRSTVTQITKGLTAPYGKALALHNYFTDGTHGFTYSLQTKPGNSGSALVDFLTNKQGYCEQYASAMAVMLRVAGVPSRVVLGYTPGTRDAKTGTWSVQSLDSHAWVEAYFSGQGWVAFDPTPLGDGRAVDLPYAPNRSRATAATPSANGSQPAVPSGSPTQNHRPDQASGSNTNGSAGNHGGPLSGQQALTALGVLAVLALLAAPGVARITTRRRRLLVAGRGDPTAAAGAAWDEVLATAADLGVALGDAETPRTTTAHLGRELELRGPATAGLRLVALAEERARYAPSAAVDGDLATAVRAARRGMLSHVRRRQRARALLVPRSVIRALNIRMAVGTTNLVGVAGQLGELLRRRPRLPRRPRPSTEA